MGMAVQVKLKDMYQQVSSVHILAPSDHTHTHIYIYIYIYIHTGQAQGHVPAIVKQRAHSCLFGSYIHTSTHTCIQKHTHTDMHIHTYRSSSRTCTS